MFHEGFNFHPIINLFSVYFQPILASRFGAVPAVLWGEAPNATQKP
jgi:hypothetical protein